MANRPLSEYEWLKGKRYIFFSGMRGYIDNYNLEIVLQIGKERLPNLEGQIPTNFMKNINNQDFNNRIQTYIQFLDNTYTALFNAEKSFLQQNLQILKSIPGINSELITTIESLTSNGITETQYRDMITAFNLIEYQKNNDDLRKNLDQAITRITALKTGYNNLEEQQKIENAKKKNPDNSNWKQRAEQEYITKVYSETTRRRIQRASGLNQSDFEAILESETKDLSNKISIVLEELQKNEKLQKFLLKVYKENPREKIIDIQGIPLPNKIITKIISLVYENRKTTEKNIMQKVNEEIDRIVNNQDLLENQDTSDLAFLTSVSMTYEEAVFDSFKQFKTYILKNLDGAKDFFSKILDPKSALLEKFNEISLLTENLEESQSFFEKLQSEAQKGISQKARASTKDKKKNKERIKEYLKTHKTYNISNKATREFLGNFAQNITVTMNKSDVAEKLTAEQTAELGEVLLKKPGKKIQLKDDIFYIIHYPLDAEALATELISSNGNKEAITKRIQFLNDAVDKIIDRYLGTFLETYNKAGSGATRVDIAKETYAKQLNKCITYIERLLKVLKASKTEQDFIWEKLSKTTMGSNSVKDYTWYNDNIGYHGGSLGSSGAPEGVIDNVQQMYSLGGISPLDKDYLLFAILNCADTAIGAKLKPSLENYLLGGAAMIMFDESVALGEKTLENVLHSVQQATDVNHLMLYFLDLTYIPASYIIYNIKQTVENFYQTELSSLIENQIQQRNHVHIINNATMPKWKGDFQQQLTTVSNDAMDKIVIKFAFMAGMLDIMQSIRNRIQPHINK